MNDTIQNEQQKLLEAHFQVDRTPIQEGVMHGPYEPTDVLAQARGLGAALVDAYANDRIDEESRDELASGMEALAYGAVIDERKDDKPETDTDTSAEEANRYHDAEALVEDYKQKIDDVRTEWYRDYLEVQADYDAWQDGQEAAGPAEATAEEIDYFFANQDPYGQVNAELVAANEAHQAGEITDEALAELKAKIHDRTMDTYYDEVMSRDRAGDSSAGVEVEPEAEPDAVRVSVAAAPTTRIETYPPHPQQ